MQRLKIILKTNLLLITVISLILFLAVVFYLIFKNSIKNNYDSIAKNTVLIHKQRENNPSLPLRLKIPSIKVDAIIEQTGLTSDGAMDVPRTPTSTAWFKLGPRPGEIGSSVIDGHFGWGDGIVAVFDNLHKLKSGDKIYIEDDKKMIITFVVRELRTYDQNDYAKEIFYSTDNKSHLNLITCKGDWNKTSKSYSERLVVFTDRE